MDTKGVVRVVLLLLIPLVAGMGSLGAPPARTKAPEPTKRFDALVVDMEGFSFVDPFSHIITLLGALIHEIAYLDKEATAKRLAQIEDGARRRRDFFTAEQDQSEEFDPLEMNYFNHSSV